MPYTTKHFIVFDPAAFRRKPGGVISPRREKDGTYRANVVIRFYDRRKMTAGYIGDLRLMHQSYEILLHRKIKNRFLPILDRWLF